MFALPQTDAADEERMEKIVNILGADYRVVADVAIGEPAGLCTPVPKKKKREKEGDGEKAKADEEGGATGGEEKEQKKKKKKEKLEWYGFIRLTVWAKVHSHLGQRMVGPGHCRTMVVPAGYKASGVPTRDWAPEPPKEGEPPHPEPYAVAQSPDKGAVAAVFPAARLVIVASHLNGTNKCVGPRLCRRGYM